MHYLEEELAPSGLAVAPRCFLEGDVFRGGSGGGIIGMGVGWEAEDLICKPTELELARAPMATAPPLPLLLLALLPMPLVLLLAIPEVTLREVSKKSMWSPEKSTMWETFVWCCCNGMSCFAWCWCLWWIPSLRFTSGWWWWGFLDIRGESLGVVPGLRLSPCIFYTSATAEKQKDFQTASLY